MNPYTLYEAYQAVYNEELLYVNEDYSSIDEFTDEELIAIVEKVLSEEEIGLEESLEFLEEARVTYGHDTSSPDAKKRAERVDRIKSAASKVGSMAKDAAKTAYKTAKEKGPELLDRAKKAVKGAVKTGRSLLAKGLRKGAELANKAASKVEPKQDSARSAAPYRGKGVGRKEAVGKSVKAAAAEKVKSAKKSAPSSSGTAASAGKNRDTTYRGAGAGSKEAVSSGGISSKGGAMGAEGKKGTALPAAKKTKGGKLPNKGNYSMRRDMHNRKLTKKLGEDYDALAEYILDDIIEQGYADTYEEALLVLENLSDYEVGDIAEDFVLLSEEIEMDEATAMAKRGLDEPAIRNQIAKDTAQNTSGSGAAADRAKALAGRETYGDADTKHQRGDFARKRMIAHRRATSTDTSLRGYGHQSNDPAVKAKQAARGAQRGSASLTPAERKQLNMGEGLDTFDVVLEYLYVEGYAETMEEAEAMMVNLTPEQIDEIVNN